MPAGGFELCGDALASFLVCVAVGLPCLQITSSAQAKEEATSIAVSCQIAPSVFFSRPT